MQTSYYPIFSARIVKNSLLLVFLGLISLGTSTIALGQILTFDFDGIAGDELNAPSNYNDANLTASSINRGSGLTASAVADRFNAKSWAVISIANAVSGEDYMEFTITPSAGGEFSVSSIYFQILRSLTGPSAIALRSSVDNYATNLDQIYTITDNTSTQNFTFTFTQNYSSTAVIYRVYMYAESASTGSGGIGGAAGDDIIVYGNTLGAEPTNDPSSFAAVKSTPFSSGATSYLDITNTWLDNDYGLGGKDADGFLILISQADNYPAPIDGTYTEDFTNLTESTNGAVNILPGVQTYTWQNLEPTVPDEAGKKYYFWIYPYSGSGDNVNYKTGSSYQFETNDSAPSDDSFVEAPLSQVALVSNITSNDTLEGNAVDVFRFSINDPIGDDYSTLVTKVRVRPYRTNTADWTDHIKGIKLYDNLNTSYFTPDSVTITDTYIDIYIAAGDLVVPTGTSQDYTLSVYLNNSNIIDNSILSFYIDNDNLGFTSSKYGSQFLLIRADSDFNSVDFPVIVDAAKLVFNSTPDYVNVGVDFTVEVWATDTNGNLDIDNTSNISLTDAGSNGDISSVLSATLTKDLVDGIYTWTDIQYNYAEGFTITATDNASSNALTQITSTTITAYALGVAAPHTIIISEIMADPDGGENSLSDANGEWFELYNNNSFDVDIENWTISDNASNSFSIIGSLVIPADGFIVIGKNTDPLANGNLTVLYNMGGFDLINSSDAIILTDDTNPTPVEINKAEYSSPPTQGSSLVFIGTASDNNNDPTLWITSTLHENGYTEETNTDNGSPGTNGFVQKLVKATTWSGSGNWSSGNTRPQNNWSKGYPSSITTVSVDVAGTVNVDINTPAACDTLKINTSAVVHLNPGSALTVNGDLTNSSGSAAGLYLNADGTSVSSLITKGSITGDATVISYFADLSMWYLVSPPINNAFGAVFTGDVVWYYDEPNYIWQNPTNTDYALGVGIGYAIYKNTTNTVTYSGELNTGDIPNSLTYKNAANESPIDGWNLMGNPYPSVLDISYLDYSEISNGVWVNLHNPSSTDTDITQDRYVYWSKTLGTVGSSGEGGGDDKARYIQPGQGFWIYTDVDGTAFNLDNSMRTHQNQGVFSKSAEVNANTLDEILKISVSGNEIVDPAYILFRSNATVDFDRDYDLLKMTSSSASVPHIFSITVEENPQWLAINAIARPQSETVIPLGLKIGQDGTYRISFDGLNSFEDSQDFYLKDQLTGELFDIRQNTSFEFSHLVSNDTHRFDLVMGLQTDINNPVGISLPAEVYSFRNTLYIRSGENQEIGQVEVKNLLGQTVYSSLYNESFTSGIQLNLPTAFYLVHIQLASGTYSKKIFIQNLN